MRLCSPYDGSTSFILLLSLDADVENSTSDDIFFIVMIFEGDGIMREKAGTMVTMDTTTTSTTILIAMNEHVAA